MFFSFAAPNCGIPHQPNRHCPSCHSAGWAWAASLAQLGREAWGRGQDPRFRVSKLRDLQNSQNSQQNCWLVKEAKNNWGDYVYFATYPDYTNRRVLVNRKQAGRSSHSLSNSNPFFVATDEILSAKIIKIVNNPASEAQSKCDMEPEMNHG